MTRSDKTHHSDSSKRRAHVPSLRIVIEHEATPVVVPTAQSEAEEQHLRAWIETQPTIARIVTAAEEAAAKMRPAA
jgi:hypothetical protein